MKRTTLLSSRKEFQRDVGFMVKAFRRRKRLTQRELGDPVGISAQYISNIERGTSAAPLKIFHALLINKCVTKTELLQKISDIFICHLENELKKSLTSGN